MSDKLLENLPALCNMVKRIAIAAGEITLEYFDDPTMEADQKSDGSAVTQADNRAEKYIQGELLAILPNIPFVGEEAVENKDVKAFSEIADYEYYWLCDPLDGTKAFINGEPDYTVNIALIQNGDPVMGVVYAPAQGILYAGHGPGTAVRWSEETDKEKSISVRPVPSSGLTAFTSKSFDLTSRKDDLLGHFKVEKVLKKSSSIKICCIAAGKADIYPRLGPTCLWDTAAADAVLRAAGGMISDLQGKPMRYIPLDAKFLNPYFVASGFDWYDSEIKLASEDA